MVGTTSACAENTVFLGRVFEGQRNYLRVRGEYSVICISLSMMMELPPRARRIRAGASLWLPVMGTTSACAENTTYCNTHHTMSWNYLRVRGEYGGLSSPGGVIMELPPRARRIHKCYAGPRMILGTTSACAENTVGCWGYQEFHGNYLRVRGEYSEKWQAATEGLELPPRARRIRSNIPQRLVEDGTTSACAENTKSPPR